MKGDELKRQREKEQRRRRKSWLKRESANTNNKSKPGQARNKQFSPLGKKRERSRGGNGRRKGEE